MAAIASALRLGQRATIRGRRFLNLHEYQSAQILAIPIYLAATDAVVQILCSGCQSDGENMWTGDWTPDRAKVNASLPTTLYRIKVVEYSYGLVGRSSPLTVQDGVFVPKVSFGHRPESICYQRSRTN